MDYFNFEERDRLTEELLAALVARLADLEALLERVSNHWGYEDRIYRFYHQSFKVFWLQESTLEIVATLQSLLPERELHPSFRAILAEGTGKTFTLPDNDRWLEVARPIVEAFFHARYFLEMGVRYGRQPESLGGLLPSGWAAFLYLYNLR